MIARFVQRFRSTRCSNSPTEDDVEEALLAFDPDDELAAIIAMPPTIPATLRTMITDAVCARFDFSEDLDGWLHSPSIVLGGATPFEHIALGDGVAVLRAPWHRRAGDYRGGRPWHSHKRYRGARRQSSPGSQTDCNTSRGEKAMSHSSTRSQGLTLVGLREEQLELFPEGGIQAISRAHARASVSPGWWPVVAPVFAVHNVAVQQCREIDGRLALTAASSATRTQH